MEWETIIQSVVLIAGTLIAVVKLRGKLRKPRLRATLKADLEILSSIESSYPDPQKHPDSKRDAHYQRIKAKIDNTIEKIYPEVPRSSQKLKPSRLPNIKYGSLIIGIILTLVFSYWTWTLFKDGMWYFAIITGFFALGGLGSLLDAFDEEETQKPKSGENNPQIGKKGKGTPDGS